MNMEMKVDNISLVLESNYYDCYYSQWGGWGILCYYVSSNYYWYCCIEFFIVESKYLYYINLKEEIGQEFRKFLDVDLV